MGMTKLIRTGKGSVTFCAEGARIETFLNSANEYGVCLWNLCRKNGRLIGCTNVKSYRTLAYCARKTHTRLRIQQKRGLPFVLHHYRKRWGIFVGFCFFVSFLLISQNFIWQIRYPPCDEETKEALDVLLEKYGVVVGAYLPDMNTRELQHKILLESTDLSWMALNRNGTTMEVELSVKTPQPQMEADTPCNIVARKTGQIVSIDASQGQKQVKPKEVVLAGDLLIRGTAMAEGGDSLRYVHADGRVIAQTVTKHEISFALTQSEKSYTGETESRYTLNLFGLHVPLYLATPFASEYEEEQTELPAVLFDTTMPFGLQKTQYRFFTPTQHTYTEEEANALIEQGFAEFEATELAQAEILSREDVRTLQDDVVTVTRTYTCNEDIAQKIGLSINE